MRAQTTILRLSDQWLCTLVPTLKVIRICLRSSRLRAVSRSLNHAEARLTTDSADLVLKNVYSDKRATGRVLAQATHNKLHD